MGQRSGHGVKRRVGAYRKIEVIWYHGFLSVSDRRAHVSDRVGAARARNISVGATYRHMCEVATEDACNIMCGVVLILPVE